MKNDWSLHFFFSQFYVRQSWLRVSLVNLYSRGCWQNTVLPVCVQWRRITRMHDTQRIDTCYNLFNKLPWVRHSVQYVLYRVLPCNYSVKLWTNNLIFKFSFFCELDVVRDIMKNMELRWGKIGKYCHRCWYIDRDEVETNISVTIFSWTSRTSGPYFSCSCSWYIFFNKYTRTWPHFILFDWTDILPSVGPLLIWHTLNYRFTVVYWINFLSLDILHNPNRNFFRWCHAT